MQGLISQQQAAPPPQGMPPPQPASAGFSLPANPAAGQAPSAQGPMQGEAVEKIQKVLLAAKKFMYSKQTHQHFLSEVAGDEPIEVRSGRAAAHVILYLAQLSKMQMNPQIIVPAGILILADIIDFLSKSEGVQPDESMQTDGVMTFMQEIAKVLKLDQGQPQAAPQPEQPMQPEQGAMQ